MTRRLRGAGLQNPLVRCESGDHALDYLKRRNGHARAEPPSMVLLDLNLPGVDGREVLIEMKADRELAAIPVVVLMASDDPRDVEACHAMGASTWLRKPFDAQGFLEAVCRLDEHCFEIAILPR